MKDRWKILIVSIVITATLSALFLFLGFSFKRVKLRQYGILQYTFYQTVNSAQTVRSNGNYLVGLDFNFLKYPKGILKHQFKVSALTKDKSMVAMEGLFLGQLIQSEILNMHFNYGPQYFKLVAKSAQEAFRQSIQEFLLTQIVSSRTSVNSYISSNVCLTVQSQYSFINCQHVSTGTLTVNADPIVLRPEATVQKYLKNLLQKTIQAQKKINIYSNGGFSLIQNVQSLNAELFLNSSRLIVDTLTNYTTNGTQIFAGSSFILQNPLLPLLSNTIRSISTNDK